LRWERRAVLWRYEQDKRLSGCGRWLDRYSPGRRGSDPGVELRISEGVAHMAGTQRCASVWSCPVCAAQIRQERAGSIDQAVITHLANGGGVEFVTLTLRHHEGDPLAVTLDAVMAGWRDLTGSSWWKRIARPAYVIDGYVRSIEVTVGANGWHPHVHALLFTARPWLDHERVFFEAELFDRWADCCETRTGKRPDRGHGVKVKSVVDGAGVAEYVGKVQDEGESLRKVSLEMTRHDLKSGRRKGLTPSQLLDLIDHGDDWALRAWTEWRTATKGRRAITWSNGLRERLLGGEELSAQEVVEQEQAGEVLAVFAPEEWAAICRHRSVVITLLEVAELAGVEGVDLVRGRLRRRWA
jgi:hypothetical protein